MTTSARRRVGPIKAFRAAGKSSFDRDDLGSADVSLFGTILYGLWWCIVGVPERYLEGDDAAAD